VLLVPFLALGATRVRPMVHWTLFAVLATTTVLTIVRIEQTDSSTAGFGVIVVPLLLTVTVLVAAVVDRLLAAPLVRRWRCWALTFMDGLSAARRAGRVEDLYDQVTNLAWAVHETQRIADALGDPDDDTSKDLGAVREALLGALQQFRVLWPRTAEDVSPWVPGDKPAFSGWGTLRERRG
jgi:hypothetical protein